MSVVPDGGAEGPMNHASLEQERGYEHDRQSQKFEQLSGNPYDASVAKMVGLQYIF